MAGNVTTIVEVDAPAPDGVVNLIVCDEVALTVCEVMVLERLSSEAASALVYGNTEMNTIAIARVKARSFSNNETLYRLFKFMSRL